MRVLRLLVYEGPEDWVNNTVAKSIQGEKNISTGTMITAITLGALPDALSLFVKDEAAKQAEFPDVEDQK
uniref:Uncharacterized protein n=1 Tax=viral metagenome TaxID=1070528 RepID=A0A6M3KSS8_9ZZZZ